MQTEPAQVPPITAVVAKADAMRSDYYSQVNAVRVSSADDITKAQRVVPLWSALNEALAELRQEAVDGRTARVMFLESMTPWGPSAEEPGDSAADRVAVLTAWRANLNQARAATDSELDHLLQDAVAFNDELLLRGALTALMERDGGRERARTWWAKVTDQPELVQEAIQLSEDYPLWRLRLNQVTAPEPKPDELATLQAAQAAAQNARQQRRTGLFR